MAGGGLFNTKLLEIARHGQEESDEDDDDDWSDDADESVVAPPKKLPENIECQTAVIEKEESGLVSIADDLPSTRREAMPSACSVRPQDPEVPSLDESIHSEEQHLESLKLEVLSLRRRYAQQIEKREALRSIDKKDTIEGLLNEISSLETETMQALSALLQSIPDPKERGSLLMRIYSQFSVLPPPALLD